MYSDRIAFLKSLRGGRSAWVPIATRTHVVALPLEREGLCKVTRDGLKARLTAKGARHLNAVLACLGSEG